jgi:hypothetical protein
MLEHLCVDLEQESKEALATWVLREAIFSPEMIWEAVPQCRCSKSERVFTVPCILHIDAGRGPGGNASLGSQLLRIPLILICCFLFDK